MVLCFGELLLRYTPDKERAWINNNAMEMYLGGSELNVAFALAKWKIPVSYCTVLPKNFLGSQLIEAIKEYGIDVSTIIQNGNKTGAYYLLKTAANETDIICDRLLSSFSKIKPGMIDWDNAFNGIRWFHFSTASAGLNENAMHVCKEALQACIKKGITVSVDLNYNPKLWQYGKKVKDAMPELLQYCNVITSDIWSAGEMLNMPATIKTTENETKETYMQRSKTISEEIMKQFSNCKIVANCFRLHGEEAEYYGTFYNGSNMYASAGYKTNAVTDRAATGDCFTAGLIYAVYNHLPFQQIINFAIGASFQKLFIKGNFTDKTVDEVKQFILNYGK